MDGTVTRRGLMRGVAGGTLAAGAVGTATAQEDEPDYGDWFDDVSNYDGTVDARGQDTVSVEVGVQANGGNFGFGPPALMVSPGTTVVWEWTGEGGIHNVVEEEEVFDSGDPVEAAGTTYEYTFEETGVYRYLCEPHVSLGMKGAVAVREGGSGGEQGGEGPPSPPDYGDWFSDVSNFDGTVDRLGEDPVEVTVGADANGGSFGFGPPAVRVSTGTTVRWRWNGEGGIHNVVEEDGVFDSGDPVEAAGTTYEYTFDEPGVYRYLCEPHVSLGMKGAIVVGAPPGGTGGPDRGEPTVPGLGLSGGAILLAFALPLAYAFYAHSDVAERRRQAGEPTATAEAPETEPAVELGHDEFDPWGTAALVVVYFLIVALLWVFMYFVEFLGRVSVIG